MDSGHDARFKLSLAKCRLHLTTDRFPFLVAHPPVHAPIGNDFHITVREEQIDQDTVIVLGVPYAQLRKNFQSPLSRRLVPEERQGIQRGLHRKADLAFMTGFSLLDGLLYRVEGVIGKYPAYSKAADKKMPR